MQRTVQVFTSGQALQSKNVIFRDGSAKHNVKRRTDYLSGDLRTTRPCLPLTVQ